MKKSILLAVAIAAAVYSTTTATAQAETRRRATMRAMRFANTMPWHGNYYHTASGRPVALIVPPTAKMQTSWGWGVAQSEMRPIYHQFMLPYPGDGAAGAAGGGQFQPTPRWPSHTDQFGVYSVRGPWGATSSRKARRSPYYGPRR